MEKTRRRTRQAGRGRIRLKRAYEPVARGDGLRVLVDRLWPRGLSKDEARVDLWLKEIAPSSELRRWFGHDPRRWAAFRRKYSEELREQPELLHQIEDALEKGPVTLLFAARDTEHNNAVALRDLLEHR